MSSKEELYKVLIETAPYGTLFMVYGVCIDANPKALEQLGCDKRQLIGTSLDEITGEESSQLVDLKLQLKKAMKNAETEIEWQPAGNELPFLVKIRYVNQGEKELIVTLETREAKPLSNQPEQYYPIEPTAKPIMQGKPVGESNTPDLVGENIPEYSKANNAVSDSMQDSVPSSAPSTIKSSIKSSIKNIVQETGTIATRSPAPKESNIIDSQEKELLEDFNNEMTSRVVTSRNQSSIRSSRDIYFDKLTGLPNRQMLLETVQGFLTKNRKNQICGLLMMMDLDHFKDINNSWGHLAGDKLLKKVGRAIAALVKGDSLMARLSGDEFILFVPSISENIADAAWEAQALAEKVREVIGSPIMLDGHEVYLTTSIGIALLNDASITAERALQFADTATYEAKRKGRNGISFFDPCITEKNHRHIDLNNRLRKALDNQEFVLFVQPQIDVETGDLVGGEMLLRWMSSDRVTNMPSEFIPLLEKSGLIVDVGRWVIRTSCEYLRNLIDEGLWKPHMRLGVNISPRQFHDPQLIDVIEHSIGSYNVNPKYLNFEITENLVIEDVDDAIKKMEQIKSLGAKFSIDDFGIGYSSMIYLKRLPLDYLKIDREFIHNIHKDKDSRGVVEAIMAVSRQYGLKVTAEGVENLASLDIVRSLGCDVYQGAHYSMPVPYSKFKQMLAA